MSCPIEFHFVSQFRFRGLFPFVQVEVEGGVVEGDGALGMTGKAFDEAVKLSPEIGEVVAGKEPTKMSVERRVTVLAIAKVEGGFADGVAGLVKGVLGEESAKDGFAVISQGPKFPKDGKGLVPGRRTPVASEGGAVAPMFVIEGGGEPRDVGCVIGFFLSGHDEVKVWLLVGRLVFLPPFLALGGEPA